ncbi:MAG: hypothetical protein QXU54_00570 [Candidatus Micrarchaeia archaeon]
MKRGFALTLSVIILLMFLVLILTVESQRIAVDEQTRSMHARLTATSALFSDIDSPALDYSLERLAKRSLYDIDMEVINGTGKYTKDWAGEKKIGGPNGLLCKNFTGKFKGYLESLRARAQDAGLDLAYTEPTCDSYLSGPFTANISTGTVITVSGNGVYANKTLARDISFSIEGLYDPMLALESREEYDKGRVLRPVIEYSVPLWNESDDEWSLTPDDTVTAHYGQGWVYGEVITSADALKADPSTWGLYILFVPGSDALSLWSASNLTKFRGVILRAQSAQPTVQKDQIVPGIKNGLACEFHMDIERWDEDATCIGCGIYIYGKGLTPTSECEVDKSKMTPGILFERHGNNYYWYQPGTGIQLGGVPFAVVSGSLSTGDKVLITAPAGAGIPVHKNMHVYDMEESRGAVLCGNYFALGSYYSGGDPLIPEQLYGPDFFQRLEGDISSTSKYGIQTFVVGNWAKKEYSKLDWQYYGKKEGIPVKGMPSCLDEKMCTERDDDQIYIGRFRINDDDSDLLDAYGFSDILYEE